MGVRHDCRHYLLRTTAAGDAVRRCRLGVSEEGPFACPEGCLFYEARKVGGAGWAQGSAQPMSNTADGLPDPPTSRRRGPKGGGKGKRRR